MGGRGSGQKRGRTQRRHFKQTRENVWIHDTKKSRPDDSNTNGSNPNSSTNPHWEPFATQNPGFEEYYKEQDVVPKDEWEEFLGTLRKPLPAAFRINSSGQFFQDIRSQLEDDFTKSLEAEANNEHEVEAIRPLPWYPENLAWHLNFSRMQLRKNHTLERFHEFLKHENEVGNITRQEAVSMVPPLFLDVLPDHHVLDMCAAPGSKTFQLLEIIHESTKPGLLPNGVVIANDADVQRCNLLIHQTKRMCSANLIVTNHEAQHFPSCYLTSGCSETSIEGQGDLRKYVLQFDRVLCDVPCSGDGTLRKAPDIWRKWNAGMGNGVHRLQVEIAMRGMALLKVGGRMVYSTCSMNPVENEAVVAEVLRRCKGSVELLDVSSELPELVRRSGLKKWKVRDRGLWLSSYKDVPTHRRVVILPSMFPSGQASLDDAQEDIVTLGSDHVGESNSCLRRKHESISGMEHEQTENNASLADCSKAAGKMEEVPNKSGSLEDLNGDYKEVVSCFPLERCMRILPHDQNTGAFFISVLQKLSPLQAVPENHTSRRVNSRSKVPADKSENLDDEHQSEIRPSEDVRHQDQHVVAEVVSDDNSVDEQSLAMSADEGIELQSKDVSSKENEKQDMKACHNGESGHARKRTTRNLQTQGKWRGVDPVVFFRDEASINSIRSFYGISELFPLDGHLATRNSDANHVKRIYYVSKSVHDILQLNFQVGQRLKITSLGLKVFERQTLKDSSSSCGFRLSSEGLPLLLPYITKQILCASLADFRHLLQYRTIKFADFVDTKFGERTAALMPGCCVIVLNGASTVAGDQTTDSIKVNASAIAIVCWKGKTNLSIMVSQLDGQELLERLSVRFGGKSPALPDENKIDGLEIDAAENPKGGGLGEILEAGTEETV